MEPAPDKTWVAAWDQLSARQDRLSRELLVTWLLAGLVLTAGLLFASGKLRLA